VAASFRSYASSERAYKLRQWVYLFDAALACEKKSNLR
jgi:hypothetical protein